MNRLVIIVLVMVSGFTNAQQTTQVLRGIVIDNISESPVPGAKIVILDTDPMLRSLTDVNGIFKFEAVPIGRQNVMISYPGYKDAVLKGILVDAGKETVMEIRLEEDIQLQEEVKVVAKKDGPINEMSVVSTHTFSMEETQKYAAAVNDPARMATSFAGVVSSGGMNNDISIRGNSPRGLVWRMEGVEIPNPNHFSSAGASGGGISIISAQLLGTSDFSTGAFAAEYGNALSGIFDLSLRKGNNEKREFTLQAGVLGVDAAVEGPFKKGYRGSYLVNYRYSTLGMLQYIVPLGDETTNFQDLSFNIFLPTSKLGNFGIFGFGGLSDNKWKAKEDTVLWKTEPWRQYEGVFASNTGMAGIWHKIRFGSNSFLKTNVAVSGTDNGEVDDSLNYNFIRKRQLDESYIQQRFTVSTVYTLKLSAKDNLKAGLIYNRIGFKFEHNALIGAVMKNLIDERGSTSTAQAYFQFSHKFSDKFTVNAGAHYLHLFLNDSYNIEPRLSMSYKFAPRHMINFGYGSHSQIQPLGVYYAKSINEFGESTQPNRNLQLNKAQHLVLSYNFAVNENHKLHAEVYYQYLTNVPVGSINDSTFSLLNEPEGYNAYVLTSSGLGRNYGVELTFERSLKKNLYYILALSLFESKYQALDGKWYDTRYNTKYTVSFTGGKDWTFKNPEKHRVFGVNIKTVLTGGMHYTPFDKESLTGDNPDLDYRKPFSETMPIYFRPDLRISLKRDYTKVTSMIAIDFQNVINRKNVGGQYFDTVTGDVKYWYNPGILPILSYRLTF